MDYEEIIVACLNCHISDRILTKGEQCVFTSLAVFPSSFSYPYLSKVLKSLEGN